MKKFVVMLSFAVCAAMYLSGCTAEPFTQQRFEAEGVTSLTLTLSDREVNILPSEDGNLHLSYYESASVVYEIVQSDGALAMTYAGGASFGVQPDRAYRTVTVWLPDSIAWLVVTTSGENVTLSDVAAGEISVDCDGGDVNVARLIVGSSASFTVKNGGLSGSIAGGWDDFSIVCDVKKGESNLPAEKKGGEKTLDVSVNNGDVSLELIV